jgi:plastocyanin
MKLRGMHLKRYLVVVAGIAALLILVPATGASAGAAHRNVQMLDDCDPATFNAVLGPGSCVQNGGTTFDEFVAQLQAQGRAPAWRFAPGQLKVDAGGTITARNRGGEAHTFTQVANFGGGCIAELNDLLGLTPVPECAGFPGGAFGATLAPPGGTVTTAPLTPGVHRYECLIHPWMRTTVTVR